MAAAKIPMDRLFLKIFFWFWLTIWAIVVIVVLAGRLTGMRQVTVTSMYSTVVPILATEAAKAYVSGGAQAFARFAQSNAKGLENQFFLFDGFYLVIHHPKQMQLLHMSARICCTQEACVEKSAASVGISTHTPGAFHPHQDTRRITSF
jgi:hypothetical protein